MAGTSDREGKPSIMHVSVRQGHTAASSDEPVLYYGVVRRLPHDYSEQAGQEEAAIDAFMAKYLPDLEKIVEDIAGGEFVPGGVVEAYECFDRETDEVVIMWRVPYRSKQAQQKGESTTTPSA
jgi:hypothetical protein